MRFLLCLFILLTGCSGNESGHSQPANRESIIRLSDSEASGLDPQSVSDLSSIRIAMDQFEGLMRFNASGDPILGLASAFHVSADGLQWRFTLKPALRFSDDMPITASHFTRGFTRLYDPATASPHLALFDIIKSVRDDGNIVIVTLKSPFPQILELLAHPAMAALPLHIIESKGDGWTAQRPLSVSGPFQLRDWQLGNQMTLIANDNWHGQDALSDKAPQTIIWKPMSDSVTSMRTFLSGAADTSSDVPANRIEALRRDAPQSIRISDYLGTYYYAFNLRRPPFDDIRVRRALSMAIERDWIADRLIKSGNAPAYALLPQSLAGGEYYRPQWANLSQKKRQEMARALLAQAGYDDDNPLAFEISFNSSNEHRRVSVAMASMWREIGVQASLLNSEASLHFANLRRNDFQLARSGWIADIAAPENFLSVHMAAAGSSNYSGFDDPQYEALLSDALQESDAKIRLTKMRRAEQYLIEQAPIIPLYHYVSRALVSPRLNGWRDNISNIHPSITLIEG